VPCRAVLDCQRAPPQPDCDKGIERGVFQKIDAVRKERDGADHPSDRELHAEVGEVQQSHEDHYFAEIHPPTLPEGKAETLFAREPSGIYTVTREPA
jgi:hypothetical protein